MRKLVVLSGAGMSEESGLKTFRGEDGLWEGHRVEDVATPEAWARDPEKVLRFYNERRTQVRASQPNPGHLLIAQLQKDFDVHVITQNIDDLHERAGSQQVLHLHGEICKAQCERYPEDIYEIEGDTLLMGEKSRGGYQLRPHVVWFGEGVPKMDEAIRLVENAEICLIVGSSLQVYPAASLFQFCSRSCQIYVIDPSIPKVIKDFSHIHRIPQKASEGLRTFCELISSK